jgi:mono/diheme cytochrome c family protein
MSPFGEAYGGPLDADEIDAVVAFMRRWEENPPVSLPPEVTTTTVAVSGEQIYADVCAQCHGPEGEGLVGPALRDPAFQAANTDQQIFDTINLGHPATAMIGWGEILSAEQIQQLVVYLRQLGGAREPPTAPSAVPSFQQDVVPILRPSCGTCHGSLGGWDAATYDSVINSGANGPAVIPGDSQGSLLAQKLLGTQSVGGPMPPAGLLARDEIQVVLDWIDGGALDN